MNVCDKHRRNPARVYHQCIGCELDRYRDEIERLQAELRLAKARAAYLEHDADCVGGCTECLRLARDVAAAEKARQP